MERITRVELRTPQELPNGSSQSVFETIAELAIRRDPPDGWPASLVVSAPSKELLRIDWEGNVSSYSTEFVVGPKPHSTIPLTTADEFIQYLAGTSEDERYLFRGLTSSEYDLVPTALRISSPFPFGKELTTNQDQVAHEARVTLNFFDAVYYQGLTIPRWTDVAGLMNEIRSGQSPQLWPRDELHEFLAIAQHHGIPTRLLDWTLDPMVAAYFAARESKATSPLMAVWIADRRADWSGHPGYSRILAPIVVPYDINRNAHAQRGVFTLHHVTVLPSDGNVAPSREPLDQRLSRYARVDPPDGVRKVTLPRSQAGAVLRLLDRRRINGATMFPGYSGAAQAARERGLWSTVTT